MELRGEAGSYKLITGILSAPGPPAASSPVGSVSRAEGIVDVNVSQFGQRRPEGVGLLLRGLRLRRRHETTQVQVIKEGNKVTAIKPVTSSHKQTRPARMSSSYSFSHYIVGQVSAEPEQ